VDGNFIDFLVPTQFTSIYYIQLKNAIKNATQKKINILIILQHFTEGTCSPPEGGLGDYADSNCA
jgi:hypothetical protein